MILHWYSRTFYSLVIRETYNILINKKKYFKYECEKIIFNMRVNFFKINLGFNYYQYALNTLYKYR